MRKFGEIYKNQQRSFETLKEGKVLDNFKKVYSALLEKYNVSEFYDLNEKYQSVFLGELNGYWSEEKGLSKRGKQFLSKTSDLLNENSTTLQKKNYLKKRVVATIDETLRQSNLKWKFYGIIDEMYKSTKSSEVSEVLSPEHISNIIKDSFLSSVDSVSKEINYELSESSKEKASELYEKEFSKKKRDKLADEGKAMPDGSYPIVSKKDLKNAIKSYGRSDNKTATKKHIKKRARALKATDELPEDWK